VHSQGRIAPGNAVAPEKTNFRKAPALAGRRFLLAARHTPIHRSRAFSSHLRLRLDDDRRTTSAPFRGESVLGFAVTIVPAPAAFPGANRPWLLALAPAGATKVEPRNTKTRASRWYGTRPQASIPQKP
jgi:hypothetical protein